MSHGAYDQRIRHRLAWLCAALLAWPTIAVAQIAMDAWTVEDGLPQSSVYDVLHTRDGYLWLATLGGLVRFDGLRFVTFDRATPGIASLRVRALHEDLEGTLWAGTEDGMLIQYRDGRFRTYGASDGFVAERVYSIESGHDGALWVTSVGRMTRFDGQRFEAFVPGELPSDVRPHLLPTGWQGIWWSQDADGIHCLAGGRVSLCLAASQLPVSPVINVSRDTRGGFWIHTAADGVVRVRDGDVRRYTVADGLPAGPIEGGMFEDRANTLWWGTLAPGVTYRLREGVRETVANQILRFYEDREGSLWLGTVASGLRRVRSQAVSMITVDKGLSSNNVYTLMRDRQGNVWVATLGAGLNRRAPDGTVQTFGMAEGLPSPNVGAIFQDASDRVIVGTSSGTITITAGRVAPYADPTGWLNGFVATVLEDQDGTLWFGTGWGLVWQNGARFGRLTSADGLPDDAVTALFRAGNGDLWIGTQRGLARLRDGRLTSYTEQNGFVGNQVRALLEFGSAIWVGTYDGGLYRIVEDRLTRYTTADGLYDNGVFQLLDDGQGYFWAGSNRGLSRLSVAELESVAAGRARTVRPLVLGQPDGLSTSECNGGAPGGLRMPDGTLWISTQGGVAVVDPRQVHTSVPALPVHIEGARINGRTVALDQPIELSWEEDTLEFDYTAPSFVRPGQVRFRYRLAGLHADWIDAGARRTAAYHRVPPGRYTFEVMAANVDGAWSAPGSTASFIINVPLWRQGWFRLSAAAGVVGLTLLAAFRRGERLKRERDRQIAYARQLVTAQEQERRRISNDLHDSLGQTLFMIRQHARGLIPPGPPGDSRDATALVVADLAARASDEMKEIAHALRPYQLDKIGLTGTLESMLHRVREATSLEIVADLENIDDRLAPDTQIGVYRIVQEAVNNIVRHAAATEAVVRVRTRGRAIEIEIWDNGKGFTRVGSTDNGSHTPTGLGLTTIRERAHALNGEARVRSTPGTGTTLLVRLEAHPPRRPDSSPPESRTIT